MCVAFSGNAAVWGYANRMEEHVDSTNSEAKIARNTEKKAEDKAKVAEENANDAEKRASQAEEARKKAEDDLAAT